VNRQLETDLLANCIDEKQRVLLQLRELSCRQSNLIAEGNITRLLSVLSAKQLLLKELQNVESKLDPYRSQDPDKRVWRHEQDRQKCQTSAGQCEQLLREIMGNEQRCEQEMIERRDQVRKSLHDVHNSTKVLSAYGQQPGSGSQGSRLDLTSES